MKLTLIILLLCISALQANNFRENIDDSLIIDFDNDLPSISNNGVMDYAAGLVQDTKHIAENIIKDTNNKLENFIENFEIIIKESKQITFNNIEKIVKDFKLNIISNRGENSSVINCIKKYRPELKEAVADSKNEANQCIIESTNEIIGIRDEIKEHIDAVQDEINNLLEIYKTCVRPSNPISTINCIRRNIRNIKKSLIVIRKNIDHALKEISLRLLQIANEARECLHTSIVNAERRIHIIVNKVRDCIANEVETTTTEEPGTTTEEPTEIPTEEPGTENPTEEPTEIPTEEPTENPTEEPGTTTENPIEESTENTTEEPVWTTENPIEESTENTTEEPEITTQNN